MAQILYSRKVSAMHKLACQSRALNCEELRTNEIGSLHLHPIQRM